MRAGVEFSGARSRDGNNGVEPRVGAIGSGAEADWRSHARSRQGKGCQSRRLQEGSRRSARICGRPRNRHSTGTSLIHDACMTTSSKLSTLKVTS